MLKRTPLYEEHIRLGARMIEFANFEMPVQYTNISDEHLTVRRNVGIFDVSHMGDILVMGPETQDFLNYVLPTNVKEKPLKKAIYSQFLNQQGRIIDDTIAYKIREDLYLVVPNASMADIIYNWMLRNSNNFDISLYNKNYDYASIAIQGPKAEELMTRILKDDPSTLGKFFCDFLNYKEKLTESEISPEGKMFVARTGYTGEDGFEIIVSHKDVIDIWRTLLKEGKDLGVKPCGLGARDTLRMEMGYPLSGQDFHEDRTPFDLGYGWIVQFNHDFIGKEELQRIKQEKQYDFWRGFILLERGILRHGYEVYYDDEKISVLTSGSFSPILGTGIGLGFVPRKYKNLEEVKIKVRSRFMNAKMQRPPLVTPGSSK